LNQQQREAFSKLLNFGPLSLLQGPPGTGKTEFIAAFVHFLVEKLNTKRILLVSQSHEAVNTASCFLYE
jgi:KaiC/GvpD/RAD55 family RecA-like ATPase